jgi:hypothetical protein
MQRTESASLGYIPRHLLLEREVRNLDPGFSLIFSHKEKDVVQAFVPWPADLPHLREIMKLDPSG